MRSLQLLVVIIFLAVTSSASATTLADGQMSKWVDIKELTQIKAKTATLKTNWKNGRINFILRLEDFPKEAAEDYDVQLEILDKVQPVVDLHSGFDPYHNTLYFQCERINGVTNERNQICNGAVNVDKSTYKRMLQGGEWKIGLAKRDFSTCGPESDRNFGTAVFYKPREWYGVKGMEREKSKIVDVCHIRVRDNIPEKLTWLEPVWFKVPRTEQNFQSVLSKYDPVYSGAVQRR